MSYLTAADFRTATIAEFCIGIPLSASDIDDTKLAAVIARESAHFDWLTNDHFESATLTLELNGTGNLSVVLPKRCTAVTTLQTRASDGTLTTQGTTLWRLVSSLNSAGSEALGDIDRIEIVPGKYLTGLNSWDVTCYWPTGPRAIVVTGTFGWTVTPADVKRAVALLVWHSVKLRNDPLRVATAYNTADASVSVAVIPPEAQDIIAMRTRKGLPF